MPPIGYFTGIKPDKLECADDRVKTGKSPCISAYSNKYSTICCIMFTMIFECLGVKKAYGRKKILRGISFEAEGGEIIGFSGDNGCGKSTLLSILAGVERPDDGQVRLGGRSIYSVRGLTDRIGYVPQTDPLPFDMRVSECLKLWSRSRADYDRVIYEYELEDMIRMKIGKLSGGMRRRVSVACATVSSPDILILDEPTAALDMHYKQLIRSDMKRMAQTGTAVILVSHDYDELNMCNTCYRITNGINEKL